MFSYVYLWICRKCLRSWRVACPKNMSEIDEMYTGYWDEMRKITYTTSDCIENGKIIEVQA